jgi:hypothetical protein
MVLGSMVEDMVLRMVLHMDVDSMVLEHMLEGMGRSKGCTNLSNL